MTSRPKGRRRLRDVISKWSGRRQETEDRRQNGGAGQLVIDPDCSISSACRPSEAEGPSESGWGWGPNRIEECRLNANGPNPDQVRPRAQQLHARLLSEARRLRGAEKNAGNETGRGDRSRQGVGPAWSRRRGIPNRTQVAVRAERHAAAEIYLLQR